jgi:DNA transformation protein
MFGLLDDDELFLKTDALSRPRFVAAGCPCWVYLGPTQKMENTSYYRPPDDAHEDPEAMLPWATLALESALRLRAAKGARGTRSARSAAKAGSGAVAARKRRGAEVGKRTTPRAAGAKRARGRPRPR